MLQDCLIRITRMLPQYYMHSDMFNILYVVRRKRFRFQIYNIVYPFLVPIQKKYHFD